MKETDLQKYVIDVVRARGGAAWKLSHRFAIGVSDLLVKLPGVHPRPAEHLKEAKRLGLQCSPNMNILCPAMLLEVKQHMGVNTSPYPFKLDVTKPQQDFLRDFGRAGMRVGVLSFLQKNGKLSLAATILRLDQLAVTSYSVLPEMHVSLGRKEEVRDAALYQILKDYANG